MTAIDDDDKARMGNTEVKLLGITVSKLLTIEHIPQVPASVSRSDRFARCFLEDMDLQLNALGKLPDRVQVQRIKDLAWQYRRQMPAYLAPKLPPHDPIVRELEANNGQG